MDHQTPLNTPEQQCVRPRPRTRAAAHWTRTGCVLPGHASVVARYRARLTEYHEQQEGPADG